MPQFARPSTDTTLGGYTDQDAGAVNILQAIDEATASDIDFIRSANAPALAVYVTKYTTVNDPESTVGHIFRNRYSKSAAAGAQIDMTFQLRQGYIDETSQGTLIVSRIFTNISDAWTTDAYTLSTAEVNAITDYTNLFLRVISNQV